MPMASFQRIRSFLGYPSREKTAVDTDLGIATSRAAGQAFVGKTQIGPYRLLSALGRGGTAQVFKAEHRHLGQIRAVKILLPEIATSPDIVGRLVTEARAMARLRHPTIAEVFECDVLEDGTAYIAMEYLPGESLRSWLERAGNLARYPMLAAAIVGVVGQGLSFAHGHGVIHRDLKPENVVLVLDPRDRLGFSVKILDFGIAKLLTEEPVTRTRAGHVVGTPVYMAPEQWRPGSTVDHRTDIYALGSLLFELLCGRPPFDLSSEASLMRAHLEDPAPDVRSLAPEVPAAMAGLIARMLAKSPDDRPASVDQVIAVLEQLLGTRAEAFSQLLRTPPTQALVATDAGRSGRASTPRIAAAGVFPFSTDEWTGSSQRRKRLVVLSLLGGVGVAGVLGLLWVATGDNVRKPPPARPAAVPGMPATIAIPAATTAPAAGARAASPTVADPPRRRDGLVRELVPRPAAVPGPPRRRDVAVKKVVVPQPARDRARRLRRRAGTPPPPPARLQPADPYQKVGS
jgi:serine/threonine protein kinase